ncbi:hypothetical protein [Cellulomonas sp.]|uniref:hypothetical protein n=1 Tax=Cellulomonas sp. TaxID=40001 RepID=UPI0025880C8E|nr:hypothetical protein [Cellulomonas sp.]MCR6689309.1 hypothetical protein [Cellulomonas sp.]
MRKRVITAAVGVVGLVVVGLGVASATVWRADDVLVATTRASTHLVVTDPGVLEMGGDPATVRVTAPDGAPVVLAIGRDFDVDGWVGSDPYTRVTGLATWHELATAAGVPVRPSPSPSATADATSTAKPTSTPTPTDAAPTPTSSATPGTSADDAADDAATAPDPAGSDMWFAQASGDGSAELVWPAQDGRWSLLVASTAGAPPTVSISWPREVTTPWLWPCVALGTLLALAAVGLLVRERLTARPATWQPVDTGAVPALGEDGRPLTRRQLREAAEAASRRTGAIPRVATGATPAVAPRGDARTPAASGPTTPTTMPAARGTAPAAGPGAHPAPAPSRQPVPDGGRPSVPASAPVAGGSPASPAGSGAPLSRRALREHGATTASTPVVPPAAAAPGAAPRAAAQPTGPGASPSPVAPTGPRPGEGTPGYPGAQPGAAPGGARQRPSWLGGREQAADAQAPATPPRPDQHPAAGGWVPGASAGPSAPVAPRPGAPSAGPVHPGPPGASVPGAPAAGAGERGPGPVPPGVGAASGDPVRGGSSVASPRWAPSARPGGAAAWTPGAPGAGPGAAPDDPATAGSRADAWRRAWGLPPTPDPGPTDDAAGSDDEEVQR